MVKLTQIENEFIQKHLHMECAVKRQQLRQHKPRLHSGEPAEKALVAEEIERWEWQLQTLNKVVNLCDEATI